jgi:hypothetical protein
VPYAKLVTDKAAASAYPGTMVVYAAVPTQGLSVTDANDFAGLLSFAAGAGQSPGLGVGHLPPGYLPMTAANGLGDLAGYTLAASKAVAAQKGALPALTGNTAPSGHPSSSPTPTPSSSSTTGSTTPPNSRASIPPVSNAPSSSPSNPAPQVANPPSTSVSLGKTLGISLGGGSIVVVIVLALAVAGAIGAPATYFVGRRRGRW